MARGTSTRTSRAWTVSPARGGELGELGASVPAPPVDGRVVRPSERGERGFHEEHGATAPQHARELA